MSFLRNIISDLVEKKLWPVAVALLAAIVAVPVVLSGGDTEPAGSGVVASAAPATTATPAGKIVSLETTTTDGEIDRGGDTLNPFVQHHVPKAVTTTTPSPTADGTAAGIVTGDPVTSTGSNSGSGSSTGSSTGSGTSTTPASTTPTTTTPAATTPAAVDTTVYRVKVKFGQEGLEKTTDDIARLTPLPSSTDPLIVFMGVKDDLKTAVFLVSADAVPSEGDGVCKPTPEECSTLELGVGDSETLSAASGTAGETQYLITLEGIHKGKAKDKASAASLHARESVAGREVIRSVVATDPDILAGWSFSKALGVLQEQGAGKAAVPTSTGHVPSELLEKAAGISTVNILTPTLTLPTVTTPATP